MKDSKRGRGRPRKNQSATVQNKVIKKESTIESQNDDIILHLPISLKDINLENNQDNQDSQDENSQGSQDNQNKNIFTINDINESSDSNNKSNYESNDIYVYDLKEKIKEQEKTINQLTIKLNEYKSAMTDSTSGINSKKVTKMNINLIDTKSGNPIVTEKTNIACWHCTHNFDNPPCFLPENYVNNTFYVMGCFCTFNCAISYNLNLNDSAVWNRYSLLKKLYYLIFKEECNINIAPPREAFEKFGGPLKYEDYRKGCNKVLKDYRFIMPPMTSIVPLIEEGVSHYGDSKIGISLADIKRTSIKRTKPLPSNKNTLFETFGIKES